MTDFERTWTDTGAEYTGDVDRARVEQQIDALEWKQVFDGMSLPFSPGEAIKAVIAELELPKVSQIAHNGYLTWPDGPETAHYSVYGIEANYRNGRARVYVLDTGTSCIPLASDFWPEEATTT